MERPTLIQEIKKIILRHAKPQRIYLYGSEATGEAHEGSDIDIALDDPSKPDIELIKHEVTQLPTLIKVDITNLAECEARFVNRVKSTGRPLYRATKALRFEDSLHNFENAVTRFSSTVQRKLNFDADGYGDVYLDLAFKRFDFAFEMGWKATKRGLDFLGIDCRSPRGCIQEAFALGLIIDEAIWLNMIEMRNLASHAYDDGEIRVLLKRIEGYEAEFVGLLQKLRALLPPDEPNAPASA